MNSIKRSLIVAIVLLTSQAMATAPEKLSFNIGMGYGGFDNKPSSFLSLCPEIYYYSAENVIDNSYNLNAEALYQVSSSFTLGAGVQYVFNGANFRYKYYQTFQDDYDNRKPRSEDRQDAPENIDFIMPYISAKYEFGLLRADLLSSLSLGYYYSRPNYISSQATVDAGFTLDSEILCRIKKKLSVGFDISALYGYKNGDNSFPEFDAERYDLTGEPRSGHYESDVYFFFPSIFVQREFRLTSLDSHIKTGIGYGFGYLKVLDWLEKYRFNVSGIGFYTSLGNSFRLNKNSSANIELGYRYLKTGNLKYTEGRNNYYHRNFRNFPLDFSGPFIQSGISFNL
jgi:hypothetical protein